MKTVLLAFATILFSLSSFAQKLPDSTFGNNGVAITNLDLYSISYKVKVLPDGKILTAGTSSNSNVAAVICRYKSNGITDSSFGVNGVVTFIPVGYQLNVTDMAVQ